MPVYEYRRRRCGREFEIRASIAEYSRGLEAACPACGSRDSERVVSMAANLGGGAGEAEAGSGRPGLPGCGCGR